MPHNTIHEEVAQEEEQEARESDQSTDDAPAPESNGREHLPLDGEFGPPVEVDSFSWTQPASRPLYPHEGPLPAGQIPPFRVTAHHVERDEHPFPDFPYDAGEKYLASVLYGPRDMRVEELINPSLNPKWVRIAVRSTGICGSDLHYYTHFKNGDIEVSQPLILGHESSGVVVQVGLETQGPRSYMADDWEEGNKKPIKLGDRVAIEAGAPCGQCHGCSFSTRYNLCPEMRFRSSAKKFPHPQGLLQEVVDHPPQWVHLLPDNVSDEMAALAEPLAVALHALRRANLPLDFPMGSQMNRVMVFGAGTLGLLIAAAIMARHPCARVVIADIVPEKVAWAVENGFAHGGTVVPPREAWRTTIEQRLVYARTIADRCRMVGVPDCDAPFDTPFGFVGTFECTGAEASVQAAIYVSPRHTPPPPLYAGIDMEY